jgi:small subunit ribosomal protein S8
MKIVKKSHKDLIASLRLCLLNNKNISKVLFSKFNLSVLSFLCNRGFVTDFKFIKEGSNGYILFCLRRANGTFAFSNVWAPYLVNTTLSNQRLKKYQSYRSLIKSFTSEFVVVSTSKGLMSINEATSLRLGGTVICVIV